MTISAWDRAQDNADVASDHGSDYYMQRLNDTWASHNSKGFCRCDFCRVFAEVTSERVLSLRRLWNGVGRPT